MRGCRTGTVTHHKLLESYSYLLCASIRAVAPIATLWPSRRGRASVRRKAQSGSAARSSRTYFDRMMLAASDHTAVRMQYAHTHTLTRYAEIITKLRRSFHMPYTNYPAPLRCPVKTSTTSARAPKNIRVIYMRCDLRASTRTGRAHASLRPNVSKIC